MTYIKIGCEEEKYNIIYDLYKNIGTITKDFNYKVRKTGLLGIHEDLFFIINFVVNGHELITASIATANKTKFIHQPKVILQLEDKEFKAYIDSTDIELTYQVFEIAINYAYQNYLKAIPGITNKMNYKENSTLLGL